ncbi:MAG: hypothetical protein CVV05_00590 [Gammaproteobacteria bacterium HGW-Gammaproteobacteria-1]|jgi:conjugal transfer/type IV secretion protein DotA/TraY|nr:MAG: hypothetical protein CVV05_00590 [Gammaproteobacteria bacterium HGW-Gammaproteobacteria-1]
MRRALQLLLLCLAFTGAHAADAPGPVGASQALPMLDKVLKEFPKSDTVSKDAISELERRADDLYKGPTTDDLTYLMLKRLLGDPAVEALSYFAEGRDEKPGSPTALAMILGMFPFIALFVSTILILYMLVGGMFATTTTGELLGKKWDTWATPARTTIAYTLLLPIPPFAPFSGIQMLVLVLVLLGAGAGSEIFRQSVRHLVSTPIVTINTLDAAPFVHSIARSQLCVLVAQHHGDLKMPMDRSVSDGTYAGALNANGLYYKFSDLGRRNNYEKATTYKFGPNGECGEFTVTTSAEKIMTTEANALASDLDRAIGQSGYDAFEREFPRTAQSILANIALPVSGFAGKSDPLNSEMVTRYRTIAGQINKALFEAVSKVGESSGGAKDRMADAISRYGFATAGMVYWTLERRQDAFVRAMESSLPKAVTEPIRGSLDPFWSYFTRDTPTQRVFKQRSVVLQGYYEKYKDGADTKSAIATTYKVYQSDGALGGVGMWMNDVSRMITSAITAGPRELAGSDYENPNPMMEMKMMGQSIQGAVVAVVAASYLPAPIAKVKDFFFGDDKEEEQAEDKSGPMTTIMASVLMMMTALGFMYANVIPALPYIMWSLAMIGYLIYVIEALVAANFWIAMKTHPEGEGLIGRAASGYPILMTLILYPILMVVGLMFGMGLVHVGGWFINATLWTALNDMNADGVNVFSLLGDLVVYAVVNMVMVYKSFSMTYDLPQSVLRWMGVGSQFADLGEKEGQQHALMVAGIVSTKLTQSVGGAMAKMKGAAGGGAGAMAG